VVRKERNPKATDCCQDIGYFQSMMPVSYSAEIVRTMELEYIQIHRGEKAFIDPSLWKPVADAACPPVGGVSLQPGLLYDLYENNVDYLKYCFASPTYCDGIGWSNWLPASNEGRMLAIAANALRWGENNNLRNIVDTIVAKIKNRMRDDGYYNYYPENQSYLLNSGADSERKNYDRVFWTRGLLAAGKAGNPDAYPTLRKMYDWFNHSPYLQDMLVGSNATNGLPGGPLIYLSEAGVIDDLLVAEKYYDQDYWINELINKEPLCISHYPGERPHCYDLLGLEAFIDEYKATGAAKYLDAVLGGWDIYKNNYKHVGGATAICESDGPYPPQSYYITTGHNGETCGSVFWIHVNQKLLQVFPDQEKFTAEIEESIYNIIMAAQEKNGFIRYHNRLQGNKEKAICQNSCCEVSSTALIAQIPELIYMITRESIYINLYASSAIIWNKDDTHVTLVLKTDFPYDPNVSITINASSSVLLNILVRVPYWAKQPMTIFINEKAFKIGIPGSYISLERIWSDRDTIRFTLPIGFTLVQYTGLDQNEDNYDQYALMYGPVLMALYGNCEGTSGTPRISVSPNTMLETITPVEGEYLEYYIPGCPGYRYRPYWRINDETFTCFPIIQQK